MTGCSGQHNRAIARPRRRVNASSLECHATRTWVVIWPHVLVLLLATVCVVAHGQDCPGNPAFQSFTCKKTKQADLQWIVHYPPGWTECEGDSATLVVFSQSGIGRAKRTSKNGNWPTTVTLRLHLTGLEHFAISAGKVKLTGSVLSHSGNTARLFLTGNGSGEERELGTAIKDFDANGKPAAGLSGKGGHFEITLPKSLLTSQPKCMELAWIDFYRGCLAFTAKGIRTRVAGGLVWTADYGRRGACFVGRP